MYFDSHVYEKIAEIGIKKLNLIFALTFFYGDSEFDETNFYGAP